MNPTDKPIAIPMGGVVWFFPPEGDPGCWTYDYNEGGGRKAPFKFEKLAGRPPSPLIVEVPEGIARQLKELGGAAGRSLIIGADVSAVYGKQVEDLKAKALQLKAVREEEEARLAALRLELDRTYTEVQAEADKKKGK